jgi:hypothetical protein
MKQTTYKHYTIRLEEKHLLTFNCRPKTIYLLSVYVDDEILLDHIDSYINTSSLVYKMVFDGLINDEEFNKVYNKLEKAFNK